MNLLRALQKHLISAIAQAFKFDATGAKFSVEIPKNPENGDLSSNVAMVICKSLNQNPRDVAARLIEELEKHDNYKSITIAGPGFINIELSSTSWIEGLTTFQSNDLYSSTIGVGKRINLEFASPNPTGPMHIGHARGAIYGHVLANILKRCGYEVDSEYYINDAGNQIILLLESVITRAQQLLGMDTDIPEGGYPGEYLIPVAKKALEHFKHDDIKDGNLLKNNAFRKFVIDEMMTSIKSDLSKLGVTYDVFISEKYDVLDKGYIEKGIKVLEDGGLVYKGVLPKPKGYDDKDWSEREQLLFKTTEFGDDVDRPLFKHDGSHTYFAGDIGYHQHKVERGYDSMLLTLGADHAGYVTRISACVSKLAPSIDFKVLLFQLVKLMKDGKPYKMSKRAGTFLMLDDVLKEIDLSALKLLMLSAKSDTTLEIDFAKASEQSKENPIFYIQYAHARGSSCLHKIEDQFGESEFDSKDLMTEYEFNTHEKQLILAINNYNKVLVSAAEGFEPLKIVNYLLDIASRFHTLWNLNGYYFIDEENGLDNTTKVRATLVNAVITTLKSALSLLNIEALKKM